MRFICRYAKKLFVLLGVIFFLCIAVAIAVDIILLTDLPRKITEWSLAEMLGGDVSIEALKTGWRGDTQLSGVRFMCPAKQAAFLEIESAHVKHHHLFKLLTGQGVGLSFIDASGVTFHLNHAGDAEGVDSTIGDAAVMVSVNNTVGADKASVLKISIDDATIGHLESVVSVTDQQVQIERIDGQLFGGEVSGQALLDRKSWQRTQIHVAWREINLHEFRKWVPKVNILSGITSGEVDVKSAEDKRPLEPLALSGQIDFKEGIFNALKLGTIQFSGAIGSNRILLTDLEIPIFDGIVRGRARISEKGDAYLLYFNCDVADIDVNQAANAFSENQNNIVGRVNGKGYMVTSAKMGDMNGVFKLQLAKSNLVNHPVIGMLYNTLNLKSNTAEPLGYGRADLRFQGKNLHISEFYYYNRGVEILGTGRLHDFTEGKNSPVEGIALATTRPLKEIGLPGVDVLDKFMSAAQKDMATVKVDGTLSNMEVKTMPLPQIQSFLKQLLGDKK